MKQFRARLLFFGLILLAVGFAAAAGRIYLKAWLAQRLLHRAWAATQAEGGPVKPWPWADTWPIARLSMANLVQVARSEASAATLRVST